MGLRICAGGLHGYLAEMGPAKDAISMRRKVLDQFAAHLKNARIPLEKCNTHLIRQHASIKMAAWSLRIRGNW